MKLVFVPARSKLDIKPVLKKVKIQGNIGLVASVQFLHKLDEASKIIKNSVVVGQVLGCNFTKADEFKDIDAFWEVKQERLRDGVQPHPIYQDIHMPKNTSTGFVIAMFALGFGFGMIWHIAWLIAVGLLGIVGTLARRSLNFYYVYRFFPFLLFS